MTLIESLLKLLIIVGAALGTVAFILHFTNKKSGNEKYLTSPKLSEVSHIKLVKIDIFDRCYSHALLDEFVFILDTVQKISSPYILLIMSKSLINKEKSSKESMNFIHDVKKNKKFKGAWNEFVKILNPKIIIFEDSALNDQLSKYGVHIDDAIDLTNLAQQHRKYSIWDCKDIYFGREMCTTRIPFEIRARPYNNLINTILQYYNITNESESTMHNGIVIIDRSKSDRKFSKKLRSKMTKCICKFKNLKDLGIMFFEKLSLKQQIILVRKCSVIIMNHGSAISNIIFAKPNTTLICIHDDVQLKEYWPKRVDQITNISKSINKSIGNKNIIDDVTDILTNLESTSNEDKDKMHEELAIINEQTIKE